MSFDKEYFRSAYQNYAKQNPPRKLWFYRRLLEQYLPGSTSPRILDMGCAFGFFLETLNGNCQKFGMDISKYAVSLAAERVVDCHFVVADCAIPPFSFRFYAIVAFDVLEHVQALDQTVEFIRGSLSTDGIFLFVVPVYDGPLGWAVEWLDHDETHVHKRSRDWWLTWTRRNFTLVDWRGILRYLVAPGLYMHFPGFGTRHFAPAIVVAARHPDFIG
jgi:SAM-dependent methyltransferase